MRLIGMMDSPYVRRVAVTLDLLGFSFSHEPVSVFSHFERFVEINPVVKAPSLVFDDGRVLMDSSIIVEYFESQSERTLWSKDPVKRREEARVVSYALAACEKSVQAVYEQNLRPQERQFEGWLSRVSGQRHAAFGALEAELSEAPPRFEQLNQAALMTGIAFQFAHAELGDDISSARYPQLAAHARRMEQLEVFRKYPPVGPGVQAQAAQN